VSDGLCEPPFVGIRAQFTRVAFSGTNPGELRLAGQTRENGNVNARPSTRNHSAFFGAAVRDAGGGPKRHGRADRRRSAGREAADRDHVGNHQGHQNRSLRTDHGTLSRRRASDRASGKRQDDQSPPGTSGRSRDVLDQLSAGQQITFEAFRTDAMPQDAYVAKSLKAGDATFDLRDDSLRPNWAIAARGGRGGGPGMGAGRGQGQGRGPGPAAADATGNRRRRCLMSRRGGSR
jgi:hypothetical protein